MPQRKTLRADEYLKSKESDAEFQRGLQEIEARRQAREKELMDDERILVTECRAAGVNINTIWDLVNTQEKYQAAIPILIQHLDQRHDPWTRQGIIRALITPQARGQAAPCLIKLFLSLDAEKEEEFDTKWVAGSAIAATATENEIPAIVELINDERHGRAREDLPLALVWMPKTEAIKLLEPLTNHEYLGRAAKKALKAVHRRAK